MREAHAGPQARPSDPDRPAGLVPEGAPGRRDHALVVLEFDRVLEFVGGHAATLAGAARVIALRPRTDLAWIVGEHARVEAMRALVESEAGWAGEPVPALDGPLNRLRVPGTSWTGLELRDAVTLLVSARRTHAAFNDRSRDAARLAPLSAIVGALLQDAATEREIDRVITDEGVVRDDASPDLRKTRKELRGAEGELVRLLERLMAKLEPHHRVDDASVTPRNGRYVIPVRREGRSAVGGIVHDTSGTGATVFVEPPAAVEAGNRIRELEADEQREVERILREATDGLRPRCAELVETLDALVALDALYARARYAQARGCAPVTIAEPGMGFTIVDGRHPLLLERDRDGVVPFDLEMDGSERTLLVSGPNTGGKTVLLKSLALISALAQSGVPAPAGHGSRLAVFDRFFADVGDEQSIEASLSTFSAHLRNLTEIVEDSTERSLVLVDELGAGTDPVEGAALGGAILEVLTRRGATTIATTHLGALKELAHDVPGVVNASLQFDPVALAPTYRLVKGIPGRSYGLSIAQRLGMPDAVLRNAEARMPAGERDVAALIEDLERRRRVLDVREGEVAAQDESNRTRAGQLTEREAAVRERERELERAARLETRRYLLDARQEIERTIRELKSAGAAQLESAGADARRKAEREAEVQAAALDALESAARADAASRGPAAGAVDLGAIDVGSAVALATLGGRTGQVVALRGSDAVVAVGAMKLTVPLTTLARVSRKRLDRHEATVSVRGDQPEVVAKPEVDVRGLRVSEIDDAVVQALDDAVRADLRTVRIIHGKGTGALRERVSELLRADARVREYRLGLWNEGGAGVTVADLE